jgi:hypothetical protein
LGGKANVQKEFLCPDLAACAAAEGVRAALAIHRSLLPDSRQV